jgi:hypothetical protein
MKPSWMTLVLVLLVGCGTTRVVYLDTGRGEPLVHTPHGGQESVRLREDAFKQSLTELARDVKPTDRPENIRAHQRENESARVLADKGYHVEQNPPPKPNGREPDYRINGEYYDCYAPTSPRARNIADHIWRFKVEPGQVDRIVLNLSDSSVTLEAMSAQFKAWPVPGLKEVIVVKQGQVLLLFP